MQTMMRFLTVKSSRYSHVRSMNATKEDGVKQPKEAKMRMRCGMNVTIASTQIKKESQWGTLEQVSQC